ncbi:MAG: hypothetical protein AAGD05_19840 [Bacteroidota bacterium]
MVLTEQMSAQIQEVYLSSDFPEANKKVAKIDATDVIVQMKNGEKHIASFFSYQYITDWKAQQTEVKDFLYGKYFWVPNMVIVDACTRENILEIVQYLIDEGDFPLVFKPINSTMAD